MCGAVRELLDLLAAGRAFLRDLGEAVEYDVEVIRMACSSNDELDEALAD